MVSSHATPVALRSCFVFYVLLACTGAAVCQLLVVVYALQQQQMLINAAACYNSIQPALH